MKGFPGFFKVFLPDTCSERLRIPVAFIEHFKGVFPNKTFLRNCNGKLWPVELIKVGGEDFFGGNGWKKYIQDNSLELGEFLVFDYDGNCNFDVILLACTACEKVMVGSAVLEVKEEEREEEEEDEEEDGEEEGGDEVEDEGNEEEEDGDNSKEYNEENDGAVTTEEEEEEEDYVEKNDDAVMKEEWEEENDDAVMEEEYEEDWQLEANKLRMKKINGKTEKSAGILKKISRATDCGHKGKASSSKRNPANEVDEDEEIFEYGMISRPKNPYFVARLRRATRKNELYVPKDVLDDFNIQLPQVINLIDERNRKWPAKVKHWKDGRIWLTGGWKSFCKRNFLKPEDRCICEFVNGRGGLHLRMCIVRAGSWLP